LTGGEGLLSGLRIFSDLLGLLFLAPFFGLAGLLIKIDSNGPAFVALTRVSGGRKFNLYKFRSMVDGAHDLKKDLLKYNERKDAGPLFKMRNDPRVTRVGRVLRKTRIDEFPQLFNVLKGEMSIVGPRPHMLKHTEDYSKVIGQYMIRQFLTPGITGWAQVNYSYYATVEEMAIKLEYDLYYLKHRNLYMDLTILLRTVGQVLRFKGR